MEALESAEDFYFKALEYDSTFAQAYCWLASIYWLKHYRESYFSETFLDSVLILCDIALSYDDQLSTAYMLKGGYYYERGKMEQMIEEIDKTIKSNQIDWNIYFWIGTAGCPYDHIKSIDYLQKAVSLNRGPELPVLLRNLGDSYRRAGFVEKCKYYYQEAHKLDADSAIYYNGLAENETHQENYKNAIEFRLKVYTIDSNRTGNLYGLGYNYMFLKQYKESLKYFEKWIERLETQGILDLMNGMHRVGYVYWQNGYKKKAENYFDIQVEYNKRIELGRSYAGLFYAYYDLAGIYAFRGEKDKAIENLKIFNQRPVEDFWRVTLIKKIGSRFPVLGSWWVGV